MHGFEPMLFGAFVINVEISTNQLTPYLSEDRDSSYYHWPARGFGWSASPWAHWSAGHPLDYFNYLFNLLKF
jgi:hypothetical protein